MRRYRGNDSSIGTGTHLEKHYYRSSIEEKRKCLYYDDKSKKCIKVGIRCVDPSHYMCTKYKPKKHLSDRISEEKDNYVGMIVVDEIYGVGMIIEEHVNKDRNVYVVKYDKGDLIRRYFLKEIRGKIL